MRKVLLTDNMVEQAAAVFDDYPDIEAVSVGTLDQGALTALIADFDAVIVRSPTKLTRDIIRAGKKLKFIGRAGVGVDNIDLEAAQALAITVLNVPAGNTVSTAEHTVALILALARRIPEADRSMRSGQWDRKTLQGVELYGKTLGILGFGRVGKEVARRMLGFSMRILAADPKAAPAEGESLGVEIVDPDRLLGESHIVSLHAAMAPGAGRLIGEREIRLMRDGAFLVNCARGSLVDEAAVLRALESGKLRGAASDVFEREPPGAHPLFLRPRTVFTPHLGGATPEARVRVAVHIAESIAMALCGGELRDVVLGGNYR